MRLALGEKGRTCDHVCEHYHLQVCFDKKKDLAQVGDILSGLCETQKASPTFNHNFESRLSPFINASACNLLLS